MRKNIALLTALLLIISVVAFVNAGDEKDKSITITGTLVDLKCYAGHGVKTNDHGDMKNCGSMCASGGIPVALVDADEKVHYLGVPAPAYADYVGKELRLTGMHAKHAEVFIPSKLEVREEKKWVEKKLPKTMM